jgi:16S rRNA (guanine527-N7)-methyltransferase
MNKQEFQAEIINIFKNIPTSFFDHIETYKSLVLQYNEIMNLTSFDEYKIYDDFFYESLVPYASINFNEYSTILDIGSGAGIPGILLKLLFPFLQLTIIESNEKKISFLKTVVQKLNLSNVILLNKRAEDIKQNEYETFDFVTSRAVAPLKIIMEISTPYCKTNGLIVQPKSKNYLNELKDFKYIESQLNIDLIKINSFISKTDHQHNVFIYKKLKPTNRKFPRK